MFMFDRFEISSKPHIESQIFLFIYHLQEKYLEPVVIDLHNHEHIITYT